MAAVVCPFHYSMHVAWHACTIIQKSTQLALQPIGEAAHAAIAIAQLSSPHNPLVILSVASKPGSPEGAGREGKESLVHTTARACVKL